MVKFLKSNKAVIVLQGRYAGRKAVIVRSFDDGTRDRPYGHCLVAGIKKYPSKVIRKDSAKKTAKKSRVKCFVKLVNYQHLMPTRYTLDVDLKDVVTVDALQTKDKKVAACKATKERFEERFKTGKNRWFFTKLRHFDAYYRKNEELDLWDSLCSFMVHLEFSLSVGYLTGDPMTMIWFYTVHDFMTFKTLISCSTLPPRESESFWIRIMRLHAREVSLAFLLK
ncbi:hypothetical protein CXB51_027810 [Gossypium anomalum]|uniref:60S ribosomal protein L27 n=1 Tax=Gossypium anomalum TaxID=47600 RepID=A0A8J5Y9Q1_9ROSI|nr:hypothetical protein CXB51_027810 [Gossypium anomalum]